jgi:hypothetical protein
VASVFRVEEQAKQGASVWQVAYTSRWFFSIRTHDLEEYDDIPGYVAVVGHTEI